MAKARLTRYINQGGEAGGSSTSTHDVLSGYVEAHGGRRGSAGAAIGGQRVARALAHFLTDAASAGIDEALRQRGLGDLVGKGIDEILTALLDHLAPDANLREEVIARQTADEVLGELFNDAESDEDMQELVEMYVNEEGLRTVLERFLVTYLYNRLIADLGDRIEERAANRKDAARYEKELKRTIRELLRLELTDLDPLQTDWAGPSGKRLTRRVFEGAYGLLE